jgi:FkbH-like protein
MSRIAQIFAKLTGQRDRPLSELASKALRYTTESTQASMALRACDAVGTGARSVGRPIVRNEGEIRIGARLGLHCRWSPVELSAGPGARLILGDDVTINYGTFISANKSITIGHRVMMGNGCIVADTEAPGTGPVSTADEPRPIEIGDDVWLAVRVTVLPGVKIGAGAVITAGSIVATDIPPGVVAGGIPARVLRATVGAADHPAGARAPSTGPKANGVRGGPPIPATQTVAAGPPSPARSVAYRGTLISDFTIDELGGQLHRLVDGPGVDAAIAPFGQVVQALMQGPTGDGSDFAVVWTRPEAAVPGFAKVMGFEPAQEGDLLAEVDQFCDLILKASERYRAVFVPTWTVPAFERGLGLIDCREGGIGRALARMNLRLMERLGEPGAASNIHVLDAQRWLSVVGKNASNVRLWYLGKVPFHPEVFAEAAREIQAGLVAVGGGARKLLVLDLDDTLWGGVVGDVGWENLRLGGHDGLGESFVDFQRAVKGLTRRGIVLAIVSKNEEATALEAIRKHPEMVLREHDFVGFRINWRDKAQNILELAGQLNLGLQSVVFIDDNPVERARVRDALPEVLVPSWPEDKHLYRSALAGLRCFDSARISREDAERTQLYGAERNREALQATVGSVDEWLMSLAMVVRAEPLAAHNVARTVQLLNKTNQMNLATRRLTEAELVQWAAAPGRRVWSVHVADRFGDAGLTGIVSVEVDGAEGRIVDFVLSCRVMGRKVEETMVHLAVEHARSLGLERVTAEHLPTAKNQPSLAFWQGSGFARRADGAFLWEASLPFPAPESIQLEWQR